MTAVITVPDSYDAAMLAVADELFLEFEDAPILAIVRAMNTARAELGSSRRLADPARVLSRARELLETSPAPELLTATSSGHR